jgi:hypothetical protein
MAGMPRTAPLSVVAGAGGLVLLLAACTADEPTPLPTETAPTSSTTAVAGRLTIQYLGDDGFSGLVFVDQGGAVLGKTKGGQTTCTLEAAAYDSLTQAAGKITAEDKAVATPGAGDGAMVPTLGNDVGSIRVLDSRVVAVADTVNQLVADIAAPAASRQICT